MTTGIYCYYDNWNHAIIYVGKDSHIDKNKRHKDHYNPLLKGAQRINGVLQNDNKSDRYSYAVLEKGDFTIDELNQKEISWIAFFNPKFCFTEGGDGASPGEKHHFYGTKLSKEHREKISKTLTGTKRSKETREKISKTLTGTKRPKETCEKMSRAKSRKKNPMYNKHHTEESRKKISEATSGKNNPRFNPCIKIQKHKDNGCKQGFRWVASPYGPDGKQKTLSSVDLQKCIEKVENFIKSNDNVYGYTDFEIKKIEGD